MDREALLALDKPALVELVLALQQANAALAARVAELEARLAKLDGPPMTPSNSSVPPSQGFKPNRAERRARRKRSGQLGLSRRRQEPDLAVRCHPTTCRGCGAALGEADQRRVGRSQVVDLPPVRPVVVEAWRYAAVCPGCGQRTVAEAPPGLEPTRVFGPGVEALLGHLHERHHLSYERLVEVCGDLFGLAISEGAVANALRRLAEQARPAYEAIGAEVRAGPVINSDETSARVNGRNWWQWVFQTPMASYHVIAPSRGARNPGAVFDHPRSEAGRADQPGQSRCPGSVTWRFHQDRAPSPCRVSLAEGLILWFGQPSRFALSLERLRQSGQPQAGSQAMKQPRFQRTRVDLPPEHVFAIQQYARHQQISFARALRALLDAGLRDPANDVRH
jgi:transposase